MAWTVHIHDRNVCQILQIRGLQDRIFQVLKYRCFVIRCVFLVFCLTKWHRVLGNRAMYVTLLIEEACLSQTDLSTFLFDVLYLFNTFSRSSRERNGEAQMSSSRGTQRLVSVNYLFGRPLIPSNFLGRIVSLNFRDTKNLMYVVFGLLKMSFWVPKKGSAIIFGKAIRPKVFGKWTKQP